MKVHEYQAKQLLVEAGAALPMGKVVSTPAEAQQAFDALGSPVVLKAQIHAGGRGKGTLVGANADFGGVKVVKDRDECGKVAEVMFAHPLATIQTGEEGQRIQKILVDPVVEIERELYVGMVLDRGIGLPVMMACAEGGVDIEEVARTNPEKILKAVVDPDVGLRPYQVRRLCFELGFTPEQVPMAGQLLTALARVYLDTDCSLAEINPLAVTKDGGVVALDAKMNFDDNALFRHENVAALLDESEEDPAELRASKAGLSFINLTGNIGCLVNGAGLAMATMDIIKYHGGDPANFLDVGGGADTKTVTEAFRILLDDDRVQAVLVNIFGGIMQCDTIAEAIIAAYKEVGFKVPLVVRLEGTNVEIARKMLSDSGLAMETASNLTEAAERVVAAATT